MAPPKLPISDSVSQVEAYVASQLRRLGTYSDDAVAVNAQLHGAFANAVSSRLNIQPHEVYELYPLSVVAAEEQPLSGTRNVLSQFAGPNAETADLHSLANAKDRLTKGDEPNIVRRETGWFKGADNKWRYEISDHQAELLVEGLQEGPPVLLESILKHDRLFEAYPDLKGITVKAVADSDYRGSYDPINDRFEINHTRTPDQQLSTLLHEIQHAIQAREGFAMGGNMERSFTQEVKDALGRLRAQKSIATAEWELHNDHLIAHANRATELANSALMYHSYKRLVDYAHHDRPSSVFRHIRNQLDWLHCERVRENPEFSREASEIYRETYNIPKPHKMRERNAFLRDLSLNTAHFLRKMIGESDFEMFENDQRQVSSLVKAMLGSSSKARANLSPLRSLQSEKKRAESLVESTQFKTPYEIYRSLAGEVEARNVQARQHFTDDERRDTYPKHTQDIDTSEVIVLHNNRQVDVPSAFYQSPSHDWQNERRGVIDLQEFPSEPARIALFARADMSTFLHESGHYFLEALTQIARSENAPEQIKDDLATIATWGGAKDLESYLSADLESRREVHERFARGFEAYIMEGNAPDERTKNIFEFFRSWLKDIYQSIKSLRVNLTEEVRSVMDRMISADPERSLAPLTDLERRGSFQERQLADLEQRCTAAIANHLQRVSPGSPMDFQDDSIGAIAVEYSRQMRSFGLSEQQLHSSLKKVIRGAAGNSPAWSDHSGVRLADLERRVLEEVTQKANPRPSASLS